jgi:hypothetical protein
MSSREVFIHRHGARAGSQYAVNTLSTAGRLTSGSLMSSDDTSVYGNRCVNRSGEFPRPKTSRDQRRCVCAQCARDFGGRGGQWFEPEDAWRYVVAQLMTHAELR